MRDEHLLETCANGNVERSLLKQFRRNAGQALPPFRAAELLTINDCSISSIV